ncbi:hypothetical protein [Myxacorys almedinensis]|uniref:Uncharacterized protein n=1 Tax=Myxacorys almedinensis A TaxID=2690445 RepID=A0A8J7ZB64_9CYAN|nr:hypothetical protein [Myxacorys almedinensis]NDJ18750.1 hypothetical protein [Myxacorys almedinensis A]
MKCVSELYNLHVDQDIYVIGTGASLRVFPTDFLENKITIGLNMAWKSLPVRYGITIHPDLNVPEFMHNEKPRPEITWITKYNKTKGLVSPEQLTYAEEYFYFFESYGGENTQAPGQPSDTGRVLDWVRQPTDDRLYMWSSISQAGVNLAANLGAKNIILVGCDNCALGGNFYAHKQHVQWVGAKPNHRYQQYYDGLAEIRPVLKERGINLISLSPFLSLAHLEEDFERLCTELGQPKLVKTTADISKKIPAKEYLKYYLNQFKKVVKNRLTSEV